MLAHRARPLVLLAALVSLAAGCSTREKTPASSIPPTAAPQAQEIPDGELARAAALLHEREAREAKLAEKRATRPEVKQLAGMIVTDTEKSMEEQRKLLARNKLTLRDGDLPRAVEKRVAGSFDGVDRARGEEFDRAYLDAQIRALEDALEVFDVTLLPSVENPELWGLLGKMRGFEALHLAHAKELRQKLL